ncbi:uncharacterized protein BX664DRAFT_254211 [Halteromyces radiatus]|uniref:uncharacterized protein n=1 Tax=Halteromyces radiatus TaxID=101107 RepID=UPI00221EC31B|nr:uncharacterized protein BX664DRAFT_254211 [Halteromyces radiatus]KAI8099933.1 hypothetical protein BX664DRAFT_254211 [Halteromyces radiatus]
MTLLYNGGYLQDDQATIASLGIRPYATIVVLGDQVLNEQAQQTASGNEEEVGCLSRIQKVMDQSQTWEKRISTLEQGDIQDKDEVLYLSEMLMRALITLDGVVCPSSFTTARQQRRDVVHLCQSLLDRVDSLKSSYQDGKKENGIDELA